MQEKFFEKKQNEAIFARQTLILKEKKSLNRLTKRENICSIK